MLTKKTPAKNNIMALRGHYKKDSFRRVQCSTFCNKSLKKNLLRHAKEKSLVNFDISNAQGEHLENSESWPTNYDQNAISF